MWKRNEIGRWVYNRIGHVPTCSKCKRMFAHNVVKYRNFPESLASRIVNFILGRKDIYEATSFVMDHNGNIRAEISPEELPLGQETSLDRQMLASGEMEEVPF